MRVGLLDNTNRGHIGDPVIHRGLLDVVIPGLRAASIDLHAGSQSEFREALAEEMGRRINTCDYVVKPGTPSWCRAHDRNGWRMLVTQGKRIAFLGIGTAQPTTTPTASIEADGLAEPMHRFAMPLIESGAIDVLVARDPQVAFHWRAMGLQDERIVHLPCPGFLAFQPVELRRQKRIVALDVADNSRCPRATPQTFDGYYGRLAALARGLTARGAVVRLQTHEVDRRYLGLMGFNVTMFESAEAMESYYREADLYIGAKVHGAMPCSGAGIPAVLLGVDGRQSAAWGIPEIKAIDISDGRWSPEQVLAWYDNYQPEAVSSALLARRTRALSDWRAVIRERTPLGEFVPLLKS